MKKFAVITGLRISTDVVDGPGWTDVDVDVDGYENSNVPTVPEKYLSSPKAGKSVRTVTSR